MKIPDLFTRVHITPLGSVAPKNQGVFPTRKSTYFFFTKRSNPIKIRATTTQVFQSRQAIHSNFWPKRNPFHSAISGGAGEQRTRRELFIFENFSSRFSEKMFKRGIFNKRGIIKLPRITRFAFVTRFPVGKWPSVRFAIQRTNKNSKLVAINR